MDDERNEEEEGGTRAAIRQVSYSAEEGTSGSGLPGQGLRLGRVSLSRTARLDRGCIVFLVRMMTHAQTFTDTHRGENAWLSADVGGKWS